MTATVPLNTELTAYKTLVAQQQAAQDTRLGLIEARLTALETVPVVTPPIVVPPPVIPPVVGTWPHQPVGFRTLTDQPWLGVQTLGWQYIKRAGSKVATILTEAGMPLSPPTALRIIFTPDMGSDNDPGATSCRSETCASCTGPTGSAFPRTGTRVRRGPAR